MRHLERDGLLLVQVAIEPLQLHSRRGAGPGERSEQRYEDIGVGRGDHVERAVGCLEGDVVAVLADGVSREDQNSGAVLHERAPCGV